MGNIIHQKNVQQLNILDDRFYTEDGVNYYPSVTTVLEVLPESYGLAVWKKDLGHNADVVLKRAGEEGTHVHDAIQAFLQGLEIRWIDDNGKGFNLTEWQCISRFMAFWNMIESKTKIIAVEMKLISVNFKIGGAIDLVCYIDGEIWLIDYKSSNYLHDSFNLQISAYAKIWNDNYPEYKIQKCGILHLKALTRGEDKSGKCYQGEGWKLYELKENYNDEFTFFQTLRTVWDRENPDYKPKNLKMPDRFRISTVQQPMIVNKNNERQVEDYLVYIPDEYHAILWWSESRMWYSELLNRLQGREFSLEDAIFMEKFALNEIVNADDRNRFLNIMRSRINKDIQFTPVSAPVKDPLLPGKKEEISLSPEQQKKLHDHFTELNRKEPVSQGKFDITMDQAAPDPDDAMDDPFKTAQAEQSKPKKLNL